MIKMIKKKEFCYAFLSIVRNICNTSINLIIGDMNAKIGRENIGFDEIIEKSLGERNENGGRFNNLNTLNDLRFGKFIPTHIPRNMEISRQEKNVDHVRLNTRFRMSLIDVRS